MYSWKSAQPYICHIQINKFFGWMLCMCSVWRVCDAANIQSILYARMTSCVLLNKFESLKSSRMHLEHWCQRFCIAVLIYLSVMLHMVVCMGVYMHGGVWLFVGCQHGTACAVVQARCPAVIGCHHRHSLCHAVCCSRRLVVFNLCSFCVYAYLLSLLC